MKKRTTISIETTIKEKGDFLIQKGQINNYSDFLNHSLEKFDFAHYTDKQPIIRTVLNGNLIRTKRLSLCMSQERLGEIIGKSLSYISRCERFYRPINKDNSLIHKFANALGLDINDLLINSSILEDESLKSAKTKFPDGLNFELIKTIRENKGITKTELSKIVGINTGYYVNLEKKRRNIRKSNPLAQRIADALNVNINDLFILNS